MKVELKKTSITIQMTDIEHELAQAMADEWRAEFNKGIESLTNKFVEES